MKKANDDPKQTNNMTSAMATKFPSQTKMTTNSVGFNNDVTKDVYAQNNWEFIFEKSRISTSFELDEMVDNLKLQGVPHIVYGKNRFTMTYTPNKFTFFITPQNSLSYVNYEKLNGLYMTEYTKDQEKLKQLQSVNVIPSEIKVKHSEYWKNKKADDNTEVKVLEKISDWTYSTPYKGSIVNVDEKISTATTTSTNLITEMEKLSISNKENEKPTLPYVEVTSENIPLHNLGPNNPIKFYEEIPLFEDELDDCGLSQSMLRFRVMGDCFFGLLRFYLRVDEVLIRIYDTRFYHDFNTNYILREFTSKESKIEELKAKGFKFTPSFHIDHKQSDLVYKDLDTKLIFKDKIIFK